MANAIINLIALDVFSLFIGRFSATKIIQIVESADPQSGFNLLKVIAKLSAEQHPLLLHPLKALK
jgi:hypothetical protein